MGATFQGLHLVSSVGARRRVGDEEAFGSVRKVFPIGDEDG